MDESSKQLIGEVHAPIPCKPGQPKRVDDEYVRHGVAEIFMEGAIGWQTSCHDYQAPHPEGLGSTDQADA